MDYELEDMPPKTSLTLSKSHVLLESHLPNGNGRDEIHSKCFPALLWDLIRMSVDTGRHSERMNVPFRQEVVRVE